MTHKEFQNMLLKSLNTNKKDKENTLLMRDQLKAKLLNIT